MNTFFAKIYLCVTLIGMTAIGVADTATLSSQSTELSETYTNAEKNYSIRYPSTWKKNNVPRLDIVLFAPPKDAEATAHASINIVSEKVGKGITLEQFYSESVSNLSSALKDVQIEKSGNTQLNGTSSKWITYTHVLQSIKFRVLQYFLVADETVYLITFSAIADAFDSYRQEFEKIAGSFQITKAATSEKQP